MGILNTFKTTQAFGEGIHTVTLVGYGESDATTINKPNGEVLEIKACIWFKLRNEAGAEDKHKFYYEPVIRKDAETGEYYGVMSEADAERLNAIMLNIIGQLKVEIANDNLAAQLELLKQGGMKFKVKVSIVPNEDGTRTYKNFSYNKDLLALAEM